MCMCVHVCVYIFQLITGLLFYNFFLRNTELQQTMVLRAELCDTLQDQKWEFVPLHQPRTEG